ncbi:MAG: hypothetical protein SNJ52_04925 [Verrucomicrobiia bacterium]
MNMLRRLLASPLFWISGAVCGVLTLVGGYLAWRSGVTLEMVRGQFALLLEFIRDKPILMFLALVILPAFPVPASPLLLAVGAVYRPVWGGLLACLYAMVALVLNMAWVWWAAAYPGRNLAAAFLAKCGVRLPEPDPKKGHLPLLLFLKVTPGIPLFLQSVILGFLRVPFPIYITISAAFSCLWVFGFVILGGALFEGQIGIAMGAVAVILLAMMVTSRIRKQIVPPTGLNITEAVAEVEKTS